MKKTSLIYHISLFFLVSIIHLSVLVAQESTVKKQTANKTSQHEKINSIQAVEGNVTFTDGTNQLLRITDEGTFGAIQLQSGVPSNTSNKIYTNNDTLYFGPMALGSSGGASTLNDLADANNDGSNVYLGDGAGNSNSGASNTTVGHNTLYSNTTGANNTAIGWKTLNSNTTGSFNTASGLAALLDNTIGTLNSAFGSSSLSNNTTGNNNVGIGFGANINNETGSNNTIIGVSAGHGSELHSKSGNVFLGYKAGYFETSNNKLYIENSDSDAPLIWGDFENDSVKVNGRAHITTSLSVGSGSKAILNNSVAIGNNTEAHGLTSIAVGEENLAWGFHSSAFGLGIRAMSYAGTAIGRYNVADPLDIFSEWNENDVIFEIGNGTDNNNRSNAVTVLKNGNVGFGPSAPTSSLHVDAVNGVLFDGITTGSIPVEGSGSRMMWYQGKSAFRAGSVQTQWDDVNIGSYSAALNFRTTASGTYSFATGYQTEASGDRSTAMGSSTIAAGLHSTAIGSNAEAVGNFSTAIGRYVRATGNGTVVLGDNSSGTTFLDATADNKFSARFAGGYRLITNSNSPYVGVKLDAGANSWSIVSDSTKKENFLKVDGEEVLNKISKFNLTSWNYKAQDQAKFRHYGPMAQEFYKAFGNDGIGTIGNDTTISSADFDGINFIAIQALEKRTREQSFTIDNLTARIEVLEAKNKQLSIKNTEFKIQNSALQNALSLKEQLENRLHLLESAVKEMMEQKERIKLSSN